MTVRPLRWLRSVGLLAAAALVVTAVQLPLVARADTAPTDPSDPTTPTTVSADPLPTVQIDGVAWTQLIVGNTVYVGGKFTTARPAGAAAGTNTTARANLLAYNLTTGTLVTTWAPSTNGDVLSITASPDNSRLYIGGSFTTVNGQIRNRIAALDPATGALVGSFQPKSDATVRAIVATSSTVYFGGLTTNVNGVARNRLAAVQASDGALLSWAPVANGLVRALALSPDGSKIVVGGQFTTLNGSGNPGYGLGALDPATGASLPWAANTTIRNGGSSAGILSLTSSGDSLYATGYTFGAGGNLEGVARMDWATGERVWVEDCHGDTYGSYASGDVVYAVSHAHYCGNLPDGFPQTDPWTFHWGTAFTKAVTGVLKADPLGYFNWAGTPSPSLLKWLPSMTSGTVTGQGQAGWTVTGNGSYVVYGGEFPRAGGTAQQGLVRYAVKTIAPNKIGPEVTGSKFNPNVTSLSSGTARITWTANWDRDNENLTYSVYRNGNLTTPIYTVDQKSSEWTRPAMGFLDTGLTPGSSVRYRVFAKDAFGNEARSDTVTATVSSSGSVSAYANDVKTDGASTYWRLGESTGTTVYDYAKFNDAVAGSGVTRGATGAITGDSDGASTFSGDGSGLVVHPTLATAPDTFTTEAWVKTTTTNGGKIIGYGNAAAGANSGSYDRHVYMTNQGKIVFGVYPNGVRTVASNKSYNDGTWHHVVASLGANGMSLYVDGLRVGTRSDTTGGQPYAGYWRVGGDNIGGWPDQPSSSYFAGDIDDVAIYPTALTGAQVRQHYLDSGRTVAGGTAPADAYGKSVYDLEPTLYWRLGETSGRAAADASTSQNPGTYDGGVTLGSGSGVGVSGDTSATFDGVNGAVSSDATFSNPTTYSEELWFKTTTTRGGKLIGFGADKFGSSSGYDRHVWMKDNGTLTFGTYTGVTNTIDSTKSYNDNQWHHVVAQQGSGGMQLFVDNELVGTNAQTGAQDYTGYWRVGGDTTWGGNTSNWFAGQIDEVAVYPTLLSAAQVSDHFVKGGGQLPNVKPTAAFTSTVNQLVVSFDGSGSTDSDGTVASYAWDFGDGATATVAKPNHTYDAAGDHVVSLRVTDDDGATDVITKTVTTVAPPANVKPTGAFTSSVSQLTVAFDGTGSTDTDGTIASYSWDFGDNTAAGTTASPSHTYAAAGTYQVTLTVTDDKGATDVITETVTTVAPPANVKPTAAFTSTVSQLVVAFNGTGSTDTDGTIASYSWDFGDNTAAGTTPSPSHTYAAAGTYQVTLTVTDDKGATDAITKSVTTVAAPAGPIAVDNFGRTATSGWGSAETGGTWTRYGAANLYAVNNGVGKMTLATAGAGPRMTLDGVSQTSSDTTVQFAMDKIPNGGGAFVSVGGRVVGGTDAYRTKVKVAANGALTVYLIKFVGGTETTLGSVGLASSMNYTVGTTLNVRLQVTGTSPTTLRAKVWKSTATEPTAWTLTTTDSTASLQAAGGISLVGYLSGSSTNVPVVISFDNLRVVKP